MPKFASVVLDVDSTLCGIEGVDWLAERCGGDIAQRTRQLTERAMNGEIPLDSIYGERLAVLRPSRADIEALADAYRERIAPGAADAIARLVAAGVRVVLVSGGIRQAIEPLATTLGVELHAVDVYFDREGDYKTFNRASPLATQQGKLGVVRALNLPRPALAVGDGSTDVAMREAVDEFAACTVFVRRHAVIAAAAREVASYDALLELVLESR